MKTIGSLLFLVCLALLLPLIVEGIEITTKDGEKHDWPNWYETRNSICTTTPEGKKCIDKADILKMKRPPRKERPAAAKETEKVAKSEEAKEPLTEEELRDRLGRVDKRLSEMEGRLDEIDQSLRSIESLLLGVPVE